MIDPLTTQKLARPVGRLQPVHTMIVFVVLSLVALAVSLSSTCTALTSAFAPVPLVLLVLYVGHWAGSRAKASSQA